MKNIILVVVIFIILTLVTIFPSSQEGDWVKTVSEKGDWIKTEGEITEITLPRGKRLRKSAIIKFRLENGAEQFGTAQLLIIPFMGGKKSVGDKITIVYNRNNPAFLETVLGNFLSRYGMYVLLFLGIIFSIKPFIKGKKAKM